jgi:hypothetical protein
VNRWVFYNVLDIDGVCVTTLAGHYDGLGLVRPLWWCGAGWERELESQVGARHVMCIWRVVKE